MPSIAFQLTYFNFLITCSCINEISCFDKLVTDAFISVLSKMFWKNVDYKVSTDRRAKLPRHLHVMSSQWFTWHATSLVHKKTLLQLALR
jgi:hypothetical protein